MRWLGLIGVICAWPVLFGQLPHALAAPDIPDIAALIDDSGPLPKDAGDLTAIPNLLFTTPSGRTCKTTVVKVMHDVTCTGDLLGAPAGTRVVNLPAIYDQASWPARFLTTPPEKFLGDTAGQVPVLLPTGHKIVFWDFSVRGRWFAECRPLPRSCVCSTLSSRRSRAPGRSPMVS
jgi:hypothetical protein